MSLFTNRISLQEILKGTKPAKMQSVGLMQVIPLTGDYEDSRFVSPGQAKVSTIAYGSMVFENKSDLIMIVPCNASYIIKEAAQDHAMSQAGIVQGRKKKIYTNAMCIQQTQGGLIAGGEYQMMILPFSLREIAIDKRNINQYNKLWNDIIEFNKRFGLNTGGELIHFFKKFEKELDTFVAEFESVEKQIGAVIMIDGEVIGIERTPSSEYWKSVWSALIRECYGSLAIEFRNKRKKNTIPKTRVKMRKAQSIEDIKNAVFEANEAEKKIAAEKIEEIFAEKLEVEVDETVNGMTLETVNNREFTGQIIRDGNRVIYASVIATKYRLKNRSWTSETDFSISSLIDKIFG